MSRQALVLYHDNCPDGFTAAWAVWTALGDEAEYRAINYGQHLPSAPSDYEGRRLIFVDFSLPREELKTLIKFGAHVEVYDHHKTAEADLRDLAGAKVVFDMARSGAGIAWDEFSTDMEANWLGVRPRLISYVEDRDLWRWKLPDSREVSEYIFSLERTFLTWDQLATAWGHNAGMTPAFLAAVEAGKALLRAKHVRVAKVCENVRWLTLAGHTIPVVNTAWDFSEIGEYLCEQFPDAPCGGYYFDRADKRQWGFRSREGGFDVSALAKQYGGGGHTAAAGFTSDIGWLPPLGVNAGG